MTISSTTWIALVATAVILGASKIVWALLVRLRSLRMYSQELRARREAIDSNNWLSTVNGILAQHGLANDGGNKHAASENSNAVVADVPTATLGGQGLAKHDSAVTRLMPSAAGRVVWTANSPRTAGLMSPRPKANRDDHDESPIARRARPQVVPSSNEVMACPQCRARHRGRAFCTADGRELVRAHELSRMGSGVSMARFNEVPRKAALSGVPGALCPKCNTMHDLSERFCGRDGTPLMIVN